MTQLRKHCDPSLFQLAKKAGDYFFDHFYKDLPNNVLKEMCKILALSLIESKTNGKELTTAKINESMSSNLDFAYWYAHNECFTAEQDEYEKNFEFNDALGG